MAVRPRALVVDDSQVFRARVRELLVTAGWDVVGEAGDGAEALAQAAELRPDLVLLDVMLPPPDGFEVATALAAGPHRPAVVLTSAYEAATFGAQLAVAPVAGFVPKDDLSARSLRDVLTHGGRDGTPGR